MKIAVIGSGLAGIVSANYFSSKGHDVTVYERNKGKDFKQPGVFRFRSNIIGSYLGCQLLKIHIQKGYYFNGILHNSTDMLMNNLYSYKVSGSISQRSISVNAGDERYLLGGIPKIIGCDCVYDTKIIIDGGYFVCDGPNLYEKLDCDFIVSTISMPDFLNISGIDDFGCKFISNHIYTTCVKIDIDSSINQTIYLPELKYPVYRATIQNNTLIIESLSPVITPDLDEIIGIFFGFNPEILLSTAVLSTNPLGKISAIDDDKRRLIMHDITNKFNVYCVGRYATWKPGLMIEDIVDDLDKVNRMVNMSSIRRKYESFNY